MNLLRHCLLVFFIVFLNCCAPDIAEDNITLQPLSLEYVDSIPLFNDSITYPYVNIQKIKQDTILAFNYPSLNLYLLNSKGEIQKTINKKGDLKGEFKNIFIEPLWGPDGRLYVLEQGSSSKLTVFDENLQFDYSVNPLQDNNEYFLSLIQSSAIALPGAENSIQVISSISNTLYSNYVRDYYEKMQSVVQFNVKDKKVQNNNFHFPYQSFQTIQTALKKGNKDWDAATAYFAHDDDYLYVKYEFDNKVYVYNLEFELVHEIMLHPEFSGQAMSVPMEVPENTQKRLRNNFALRYSKPYYYSISVADGVIFLLYSKPVTKDLIPTTVAEERDFIAIPVLHVYDTNTQEEYFIELGDKIDPYARINSSDKNTVYLLANTKLTEDIYLYTCEINYPK